MTSEEIDRLEADRDTDALVAELLPLPGVRIECVPWQPDKRCPYWRYIKGGFREQFRPSIDPAAAALVCDWLRSGAQSNGQQGGGCLTLGGGDELSPRDTAELAICKAALLAVMNCSLEPEAPAAGHFPALMTG